MNVHTLAIQYCAYIQEEYNTIEQNSIFHEHFILQQKTLDAITHRPGKTHTQFVEVFYDTADYRLLMRDIWLKYRQGTWSLKQKVSVPLNTTN